ncbi:hypothetical protein LCGC14_1336290 [marine sediment metagenome]|uniref:Uncharacterized protein n=1 Tax=marine sediment metagenome TaxID=412755 RepID=A0A0F9MW11_9ZZZZ
MVKKKGQLKYTGKLKKFRMKKKVISARRFTKGKETWRKNKFSYHFKIKGAKDEIFVQANNLTEAKIKLKKVIKK